MLIILIIFWSFVSFSNEQALGIVPGSVPFDSLVFGFHDYPNNDNNSDVVVNTFFIDHHTAMKIPVKVMSYTTTDLYRQGFVTDCKELFSSGSKLTDEQRLTCNLLENYSPEVRPVRYKNDTLTVRFALSVNQVFDLDDRNQIMVSNVWYEQSWVDYGLTWNPSEYNNLKVINLPSVCPLFFYFNFFLLFKMKFPSLVLLVYTRH